MCFTPSVPSDCTTGVRVQAWLGCWDGLPRGVLDTNFQDLGWGLRASTPLGTITEPVGICTPTPIQPRHSQAAAMTKGRGRMWAKSPALRELCKYTLKLSFSCPCHPIYIHRGFLGCLSAGRGSWLDLPGIKSLSPHSRGSCVCYSTAAGPSLESPLFLQL